MSTDRELPGYAYRAGLVPAAPLRLAPQPVVYKSVADTKKLTVTSILTYPCLDLVGDYVNPAGGDWTTHKARPWVGLDHLRWHTSAPDTVGLMGQPGIGTQPVVVGYAQERPGAPYAVELKSFDLDGTGYELPVGTTYFDPNDRLSAQAFAAVAEDVLPGVSLEFLPDPSARRVLKAHSPLAGRPAYEFERWRALSWVHCGAPVNPGATVCKALEPGTERLLKALSDKRIGGEAMHPVIFKALSRYAPEPTTTTVHVHRAEMKAMDNDANTPLYDAVDTGEPAGADAQPPAKPTVQAHYDLAQGLLALCDQAEQAIEAGEHVAGRKHMMKLVEQLKDVAAKSKGMGDKIDSDFAAKTDVPEEPVEETETDETGAEMDEDDEDEAEEGSELEEGGEADEMKSLTAVDMSRGADGVLSAVRPVYKAVLAARVRRIGLAEVQKARPASEAAAPRKAEKPAADGDGDDPADIARLERALKERERLRKKGLIS